MANVWFISDIHGGHKNLVRWRDDFETEEEHFEFVKENYHKVVTKRDHVYFLGDIAFNQERLWDISGWGGEKKILVCGNHDTEHLSMRDLANAFDEVHALVKYKEFWLSHAPVHSDELRGKVNIHGHCHNHLIDDPRYVNVCLEHTDYAPISLEAIRSKVAARHSI
jgi:calcineurin-like phosphoesterase family protein